MKMENKDMLGLGKVLPIKKLIDVVSSCVGRATKSYFDKKDIDTKAYEMEQMSIARSKQIRILSEAMQQQKGIDQVSFNDGQLTLVSGNENALKLLEQDKLDIRIAQRVEFQQSKRQLNVENITGHAADTLKGEPSVTDEPLDEDWTAKFFSIAEDISSEDMQILWGKILANEIKKPKTYSLRTLDLIRNLSKTEAETFTNVAKFAIRLGSQYSIFTGKNFDRLRDKFNISLSKISILREAGLIQTSDNLAHIFRAQPKEAIIVLFAGAKVIILTVQPKTQFSAPAYIFTSAGCELMTIVKSDPPLEYIKFIGMSLKKTAVDVKIGHLQSYENNELLIEDGPIIL